MIGPALRGTRHGRRPGSIRTGVRRLGPLAVAVAVGTAGVVGVPLVAGTAGAVTTSAELIAQPGTTTALGSGGSATPYGVVLPAGASCPGDTAHDGYHVYSYLVPRGASPTDVSFRTGIPSRWFGYIADGAYFGAVNTAESTGQIVGLPTSFTWSRLTPADLFPNGAHSATWDGGIACADTHGVVTDVWGSTIRFTADAADPGGFTWAVVDQGAVPASSPSRTGLWIGIGLLIVASGATAYALRVRRRDRGAGSGEGEEGGTAAPADPSGPAGSAVEPHGAPGTDLPADATAGR